MYGSRYLENKVLAANALGLVRLLYEGAIDSLLQARAFLRDRKIQERSNAISKAMQVVAELQGSLDMKRGGDVAQNLAELYAYIQTKLIEANAEQRMEPLQEALSLLMILYEGWKDITAEPAVASPAEQLRTADSPLAWTL